MEQRFATASYKEGVASGHALYWDRPSYIPQLGRHESFSPNSFDIPKSVPVYLQHDRSNPLANSASGTCKLKQTSSGLEYEISLPKSAIKERELLERGDLQGVSIGFQCKQQRIENGIRKIDRAILNELSLVCNPSHKTSLSYRNKGEPKPRIQWSKTLWRY